MKKKSFVKVLVFSLVTLVSIGMLTACSRDDDDNEEKPQPEAQTDDENPDEDDPQPGPEPYHPIYASTKTLLEVTERTTYTPTEFGDVIGNWPMLSYAGEQFGNVMKRTVNAIATARLPLMDLRFLRTVGLAQDGSRQWVLQRRLFTYKSVSLITGNDTTLVGSVIFPTNTVGRPHKVDILTLYHHQAYFSKSWLPSQALTLMALHALNNSAVIEPDGQGASDNMSKLVAETLYGDRACLQMVDCVVAALEVMKEENVTLSASGYSNNWGTSLGTTSATGFAQYMERDATPYFQQLIKLHATYIGEGPTKFSQIKGCKNREPYLPVQKYFEGWYPSKPFYMSSCKDDELIVYDELKDYYNKLRTMPDGTINPNVHWSDFYLPDAIKKAINSEDLSKITWGMGNHLVTAVVSLIYASMVKDPEDMERIFLSNNIFNDEEEK